MKFLVLKSITLGVWGGPNRPKLRDVIYGRPLTDGDFYRLMFVRSDFSPITLSGQKCFSSVHYLQISELQSWRGLVNDIGSFTKGSGGSFLAVGGYHLGTGLARSLSLGSHGTLKLLGQSGIFSVNNDGEKNQISKLFPFPHHFGISYCLSVKCATSRSDKCGR